MWGTSFFKPLCFLVLFWVLLLGLTQGGFAQVFHPALIGGVKVVSLYLDDASHPRDATPSL